MLLVTDIWNAPHSALAGSLQTTMHHLEKVVPHVQILHPGTFKSYKLPFGYWPDLKMAQVSDTSSAVWHNTPTHIATEGWLGLACRQRCIEKRIPFTSSCNYNLLEIIKQWIGIPEILTFKYLKWFHAKSQCVMVPSSEIQQELNRRQFHHNVQVWHHGVDLGDFHPLSKPQHRKPACIYVGKLTASKRPELDEFLNCTIDYNKIVVGDGPLKKKLQKAYPDTKFLGYRHGENLIQAYSLGDVFVWPSYSDGTSAILEAMACGLSVAAYPTASTRDIVVQDEIGCLHDDLKTAIETAYINAKPTACRKRAMQFTWGSCTLQLLRNMNLRLTSAQQKILLKDISEVT